MEELKDYEMWFEDWAKKYKPERFDNAELIKDYPDDCIWTEIDTGGYGIIIVPSFHVVNALGYYVTEIPYKKGDASQILYEWENYSDEDEPEDEEHGWL